MFLIDKHNNSIKHQIKELKFGELGFKERQHLQKWIAENPEMLGEDLLIIQQEFDGFSETNERLDLLALDKIGNIVVIENKLDDTGRDVTWQVMKYASYCSTLTKDNIRKIYQDYLDKQGKGEIATERISEFYDGIEYEEIALNHVQTQRIMMVAGNFRKEVTSTALWLLNYKLRIQCFKATLYSLVEELILDLEQIIPTKDAADYVISMADKTQEDLSAQSKNMERHKLRFEFWNLLLPRFKGKTQIFQAIIPSKDHWISSGAGVGGLNYACLITRDHAGIELAVNKSSKDENKIIFDEILKYKDDIESDFGHQLSWERLDDKKMSRIAFYKKGLSVFDKNDWPEMLDFIEKYMVRFESVLKQYLLKVKQSLKTK